jgi:ribosomal-protein-alanine N-acetyltransferase
MRELDTDRLRLRPAEHADLDRLWVLWTDPEVRRFLWDDEAISREHAAEVLNALIEAGAESGRRLWTLWVDGEFAGCCGLLETTDPAEPDPMCALLPAMQHRGYATEALRAMIAHAFADLGVRRLSATVDLPNQASHRLVQRLGFARQGEMDGPKYRMVLYTLTPLMDTNMIPDP